MPDSVPELEPTDNNSTASNNNSKASHRFWNGTVASKQYVRQRSYIGPIQLISMDDNVKTISWATFGSFNGLLAIEYT
eukprot:UN09003